MKKILFRSSKGILFFALITFSSIGPISAAFASTVTIPLNVAFSNYEPPLVADFGTVEISQSGNNVQFEVTGLSSGAGGSGTDLQWLYFNTASNLAGLTIELSSAVASLFYSFDNTESLFKADGAGYFDGFLDFGFGAPQLDMVTVILRATNPITVNDFFALSTPSSKGEYTLAAHLQGTNTGFDSEFVGGNPIPVPGTLLLLGSGLLGLGVIKRKKFFDKS